jgi:hypothetical protein
MRTGMSSGPFIFKSVGQITEEELLAFIDHKKIECSHLSGSLIAKICGSSIAENFGLRRYKMIRLRKRILQAQCFEFNLQQI